MDLDREAASQRGEKKRPHLKHREDGCRKGVEVCRRGLVFKVKSKKKHIQNDSMETGDTFKCDAPCREREEKLDF